MTWITAAEALRTLHVLPQTLYANVSRGKIRAKPDEADPRRRLYHRDDVLRMAARANGRRKVETVAAQAIEWGDPVLPSAISTVRDGWLWYRGQDAAALAEATSFEDVTALLWAPGDDAAAAETTVPETPGGVPRDAAGAFARGLSALAARVPVDAPTAGRSPGGLRQDAAQVQATLADAMLGPATAPGTALADRLAQAWDRPEAADLLRRALVLLADHELNASTFSARVTVSTGASLAAGVLSGLTTLSGPLHGGMGRPIRALFEAARREGVAPALLRLRDDADPARRAGHPLPGFGHPLYPAGDVRAIGLLAGLRLPALHAELVAAAHELHGERPNIDFALATLTDAVGLPVDAPFVLFALGRCAGWLAHALEQAQTGHLIRPRARYVGIVPGAAD